MKIQHDIQMQTIHEAIGEGLADGILSADRVEELMSMTDEEKIAWYEEQLMESKAVEVAR